MISSEFRASNFNGENVSKPVPARLIFKPLPLSAFQEELEKARNEPLPTINISNSELETDDANDEANASVHHNSCDSLPSIPEDGPVEMKENQLAKPLGHSDKFREIKVTPAKVTPSSANHNKFLTPRIRPIKTPLVQKSTPIEPSYPKIQYTISAGSYLNTPLTKMTMMKRTPDQTSRSNVYRPMSTQKSSVKQHIGVLQERNFESEFENSETAEMDVLQATESKRVKIQDDLISRSPVSDFKIITVKGVDYVALNQLGVGGSSVVWNCFDPTTKSMRAIKRVNLTGDNTLVTGYINEVKLLEKLQKCDRIIRLFSYEIIESERVLLMVLEKGDADLAKILKDLAGKSDHLPMFKLFCYWMEMLYAVKQIHDNDVIHSDLKPANFLQIFSGLKLIDFGIASCIQSDMTSVIKNVPVGSFNYISPEALSSDSSGASSPKYKVSFKSDVWSLGCILYQLVYRRTPFQHIGHPFAKMMAIADPKQQIKYPETDGVPSFITNMIKLCLQHDMKSRPSVQELIRQTEEVLQFN